MRQTPIQRYITHDEKIDRCIVAFYNAIKSNLNEFDDELVAQLAYKIVECMKKKSYIDNTSLMRSKLLNLKDKNNRTLCQNVYESKISVEEFVMMSQEEMRSEELKKKDTNIHKNNLLDMQVPQVQAETNIFKCGKCGKRESSYRQLQTRSADEPMTTFVTCVCGHRWKF